MDQFNNQTYLGLYNESTDSFQSTLANSVFVSDANNNVTQTRNITPNLDNTSLDIVKLNVTGTPSITTFLRGDGTWSVGTTSDVDSGTTTLSTIFSVGSGTFGTQYTMFNRIKTQYNY